MAKAEADRIRRTIEAPQLIHRDPSDGWPVAGDVRAPRLLSSKAAAVRQLHVSYGACDGLTFDDLRSGHSIFSSSNLIKGFMVRCIKSEGVSHVIPVLGCGNGVRHLTCGGFGVLAIRPF